MERHSNSSELCIDLTLGQCAQQHTRFSFDLINFQVVCQQLKEAVEKVGDTQEFPLQITWADQDQSYRVPFSSNPYATSG